MVFVCSLSTDISRGSLYNWYRMSMVLTGFSRSSLSKLRSSSSEKSLLLSGTKGTQSSQFSTTILHCK